MAMKKWVLSVVDRDRSSALAEECGIDPFLALLLVEQGIDTPEEVDEFLNARELTDDPFLFMDMDLAVDRIQRAIDNGESIAIFGDYDADGITATVLLYSYLVEKGATVQYLLPQREGEGYGLHTHIIQQLIDDNVRLLITVDNGIAANEEIRMANDVGIDVVVTDHHLPQEDLPPAVAVVNPHREDCESEFKGYAGVGVAFKLVCALEGDPDLVLERYADLVAIGTLADIMPLKSENRVLVRAGLEQINRGTRPGLVALSKAAGADKKKQTSSTAVFTLAPRINAAGRMGDPYKAAELLLETNPEKATTLAEEIQAYNVKRQATEADILKDVTKKMEEHPEWMKNRVLVINGEGWFSGVVGILAARILERYGKPCILLSTLPDKVKGSGRSIKGFPLFDAIASCADILTSYGGHELAAGVSLKEEYVDEFRMRINQWAEEHFPSMPIQKLPIACKLSPRAATIDIVEQISALEPYGSGNKQPIFAFCNMTVQQITPVSNGKHLRLILKRGNETLSAMWFHTAPEDSPFREGDTVDVAATMDKNEFRGITSVSIIVKDIVFSIEDRDHWISALQDFESILWGNIPVSDGIDLLPSHDELSKLYLFLKSRKGYEGRIDGLRMRFNSGLSPLSFIISLQILAEAKVIHLQNKGEFVFISVPEIREKCDLKATNLWKSLSNNS